MISVYYLQIYSWIYFFFETIMVLALTSKLIIMLTSHRMMAFYCLFLYLFSLCFYIYLFPVSISETETETWTLTWSEIGYSTTTYGFQFWHCYNTFFCVTQNLVLYEQHTVKLIVLYNKITKGTGDRVQIPSQKTVTWPAGIPSHMSWPSPRGRLGYSYNCVTTQMF